MTGTDGARRTVLGALALALSATACTGDGTLSAAGRSSASPSASAPRSRPAPKPFATLPGVQECERRLGAPCYTLDMIRKAYGIDKLNARGLKGKGRTIAVFTVTAPPTLEEDLAEFSAAMRLPNPQLVIRRFTSESERAPFDAGNPQMVAGAVEATLDVQVAHMMAPDARIVVAELGVPRRPPSPAPPALAPTVSTSPGPRPGGPSPVPPDIGVTAGRAAATLFPVVFTALRQDVPDVISVSYAAQEYQAAGNTRQPVAAFKTAGKTFAGIVRSGTTLVAAAGDWGAAPRIGKDDTRVRSVSWPGSDPSVVSVGGSRLHLDADGARTAADTVWNDAGSGLGATGGGPSQTFERPAYQDGVQRTVGRRRGTPDLSMSASTTAGALIRQSFLPAGKGWITVGGSSEAAPLFAAVVALANEKAGRRLGDVHAALYTLARRPDGGIVDITEGDNGPDGFRAAKGYDLASGLGTIDAAAFVTALAATG
ncbi:S53 family peptidase [Streptomyces sp. NPDC001070]